MHLERQVNVCERKGVTVSVFEICLLVNSVDTFP